jgi:hypothetical protein
MTTIDSNDLDSVNGGILESSIRSTGPTFPRPFPPPSLPAPKPSSPTIPLGPFYPDVPPRNDIA